MLEGAKSPRFDATKAWYNGGRSNMVFYIVLAAVGCWAFVRHFIGTVGTERSVFDVIADVVINVVIMFVILNTASHIIACARFLKLQRFIRHRYHENGWYVTIDGRRKLIYSGTLRDGILRLQVTDATSENGIDTSDTQVYTYTIRGNLVAAELKQNILTVFRYGEGELAGVPTHTVGADAGGPMHAKHALRMLMPILRLADKQVVVST